MKLYLIQKESVAPFSPQQQELYTLAQTKTGKLLDSIDKLLQDSIDYKGLHVEMKELEISTFIQQLTEDWQRSVTGEKEIKLQVSMQMENTLIRADAYHLSRAIWNLLENAWKYSDDRVQIDITCRRIGRYVEISVKDNGRGIDKSELKNVFKKELSNCQRRKPESERIWFGTELCHDDCPGTWRESMGGKRLG